MKTRFAINLIEKWSYDYIKMDCEGDKCYGVLAVSNHDLAPVGRLTIVIRSIVSVSLSAFSTQF